jgi:hypothetical protein
MNALAFLFVESKKLRAPSKVLGIDPSGSILSSAVLDLEPEITELALSSR